MSLEYAVGYGKPPLHSRFRPGQSGNPRGRPMGALGLKATLRRVLRQTVTVREGEVVRRVTRLEAVLLSLIARAGKGDAKAIAMVLELSRLLEQDEAPAPWAGTGGGAKQELATRLDKIAERLHAAEPAADAADDADGGGEAPHGLAGHAPDRPVAVYDHARPGRAPGGGAWPELKPTPIQRE